MFEFIGVTRDRKKSKIERIYELFNKSSVEPSPNMTKVKKYSGDISPMMKDKMIYRESDNKFLVVRWDTVRKKPEFDKGISFYFPEEKIKISALYHEDGKFEKYYCEVVEAQYIDETDTYIFTDLIVDVNLNENGKIEVLDEDELEIALKEGTVTPEKSKEILTVKDNILNKIKTGQLIPDWCISKVENRK